MGTKKGQMGRKLEAEFEEILKEGEGGREGGREGERDGGIAIFFANEWRFNEVSKRPFLVRQKADREERRGTYGMGRSYSVCVLLSPSHAQRVSLPFCLLLFVPPPCTPGCRSCQDVSYPGGEQQAEEMKRWMQLKLLSGQYFASGWREGGGE